MSKKPKFFYTRLNDSTRKNLKLLAVARGTTLQALANEAIDEFVRRHNDEIVARVGEQHEKER